MKINQLPLLVWSKDRAAQLDLLLESVKVFGPSLKPYIIYKADGEYKKGYEKCIGRFPTSVFIEETDFRQNTLSILERCKYFCISTDDTVLFRSFSWNENLMDNVGCFSLRLGQNCLVQEPFTKRLQPALTKFSDEEETISWDSRLYHPFNNFGYLYGMDMCIYGKRYYELIKEVKFKKTNDIESYLTQLCQGLMNPFIRSFKHSCAVNIPANNISQVTHTDNSVDIERTNQKYLDGYRFTLESVFLNKIVGCHQIMNFRMEKA